MRVRSLFSKIWTLGLTWSLEVSDLKRENHLLTNLFVQMVCVSYLPDRDSTGVLVSCKVAFPLKFHFSVQLTKSGYAGESQEEKLQVSALPPTRTLIFFYLFFCQCFLPLFPSVCIVGPNGVGKSTLLLLLTGKLTPVRNLVLLPTFCFPFSNHPVVSVNQEKCSAFFGVGSQILLTHMIFPNC